MALPGDVSQAGPWRVEPVATLSRAVLEDVDRSGQRPAVLAVDGRSSSGKSTLATRIARVVARSAVIHTDDLAWWHSRFGWTDLIIDGVLDPVRSGRSVRYRPPAWNARARGGSIEVPATTELLIVEGVGAGRRELAPFVDGLIWVQCDRDVADQRSIERVGQQGGPRSFEALREWMAEETPFLAEQRPWSAHMPS